MVTTTLPGQITVADPYGIIDQSAMEAAEQSSIDAFNYALRGWSAGDVELLPAAAIVAGGAKIETTLLNNEHWDNFWISVGGRLNDVWHSAANFLFGGGSSGPNWHETGALINLGMHTVMRAARQLSGQIDAKRAADSVIFRTAINNAVKRAAKNATQAHREALHVDAHAQQLHADAVAYANARAHNVGVASEQYTDQQIQGLKQWTIDHAIRPTQQKDAQQDDMLDTLRQLIHVNGLHIDGLAGSLGAVAALLHQAEGQIGKLATEAEECTEPMCETVGPKTDWGKLFKRFTPALIWALLAELAALHPDVVEHYAEDLATALGPVLERFAEGWIGVLPGGTGEQVKEVEGHVGTWNPLTGP